MNKGRDCYGNWRSNTNTVLNSISSGSVAADAAIGAPIRTLEQQSGFAHVAAQIKATLMGEGRVTIGETAVVTHELEMAAAMAPPYAGSAASGFARSGA